ncbi:maleylpyruvate isomerase family mycothiol-dependent enzyme [Geodermatophilus sp. CPCC 206100]|uniref:maleylpyruvate isomerase family mycothiol-dependent enzyme n=1 Tax=Geodermatophilus sp. CPCC 206100 TaxID=3020054 RepID=UPI003AFFCA74
MTKPETLDWWADGERLFGTALGRLTDEEFDAPSLLPGWDRRTVLGHVARNADALCNLLAWARTGVETPMYPSTDARDRGIAEAAALPAAELRAEVLAATGRLADAVHGLPDEAWSATVRTAQGREVPASEVTWMRCREVYVHAVDLDAGVGFADVAEEVQAAMVDDVFRMWDRRDQVPDVVVFAGDREWGTGAVAVSGPLPAVTGWLTGRTRGEGLEADGGIPEVPAWL